jgi:hypothetical protein
VRGIRAETEITHVLYRIFVSNSILSSSPSLRSTTCEAIFVDIVDVLLNFLAVILPVDGGLNTKGAR